jgi:hypothetical protein
MSSRSTRLKKLSEVEQALRRRALPSMTARGDVEAELQRIDRELRELSTAYEQYFMGIDKFEPAKEREILALRLRRMINGYIPQTDLRFRLQGLAGRLQSFSAYWDRILRLIEEGRYERQRSHMRWAAKLQPQQDDDTPARPSADDPFSRVYGELVEAYASCRMAPPQREQIQDFLSRQTAVIRERFGDRPVEFSVVVADGKPKIKVRTKG